MAKRPIIALLVARKLSSWKSHSLTPIYLYQRLKELIMFKGRSQSFKCRKFQGLSPMLLKTNSVYSACASHSHLFSTFPGFSSNYLISTTQQQRGKGVLYPALLVPSLPWSSQSQWAPCRVSNPHTKFTYTMNGASGLIRQIGYSPRVRERNPQICKDLERLRSSWWTPVNCLVAHPKEVVFGLQKHLNKLYCICTNILMCLT